MTLPVAIPGRAEYALEHLMLDVNGTLTDRGVLLDGVGARIDRLRPAVTVHLVSADTFGTVEEIATGLGVSFARARSGADKLRRLQALGAERCAVVGNGANDELVLAAAALGIVVIGPEGASARALMVADVVCASVLDALDLLLSPMALAATLRP